MAKFHFHWQSYLLGIGTVVFVIVLAWIMVSWGFQDYQYALVKLPPEEPMNWTAENVTDEGEAPPIEFLRRDEDATLWRCVCMPPTEEPIHLGGFDTGIGIYGTDSEDDEPDRLAFIAGGHEFVRCTPVEDQMPLVTFKVQDHDKFCFYHDHEVEESRVYVGLEGHGHICAEAAEELTGPLELKPTGSILLWSVPDENPPVLRDLPDGGNR